MPPKRKANSEAPVSKSKPTGSKTEINQEESSSKKAKPGFQKIVPDVTKEEFLEVNHPIEFTMNNNGEEQVIKVKASEFSTGSFGWKTSERVKIKIKVDGVEKELQVQLGINMTVSGSKPTKKEAAAAAAASNGKKGKTSKKAIVEDEEDDDE
ncbi:uncharacterized protein MELLADRAFT_104209 [Melampsora larici-populina 98AG31]|uniref:Uncharacterized protein n=1 Tax=Melampsora larici-populina (strain 98AG31 / pathotype 3-4-7) TaxID=747676 RepID=F4RDY3_MELLP|nr:uncharacterized protein MELLADRAFT_104209 [Melampsora larici-populina 98AG31]EGG09484.1 hypothetical protein MELLADRAFT_104209 [Melampsora larici-populina 98AG31]